MQRKLKPGQPAGGTSALRAGAEEDEPGDEVPDLALRRLAAGCVNKVSSSGASEHGFAKESKREEKVVKMCVFHSFKSLAAERKRHSNCLRTSLEKLFHLQSNFCSVCQIKETHLKQKTILRHRRKLYSKPTFLLL